MKRSIKVVSTVFVMLILSTFSVFGTYFLTEHDAFESIMSNARATRCQGVVLRDQGYYNEAYSHISMECMLNSKTASTSVIVSGETPSSRKKCYAETYVYNTSGTLSAGKQTTGGMFTSTASASIDVSSISVGSIMHIGNNPNLCSVGEHHWLIYK